MFSVGTGLVSRTYRLMSLLGGWGAKLASTAPWSLGMSHLSAHSLSLCQPVLLLVGFGLILGGVLVSGLRLVVASLRQALCV